MQHLQLPNPQYTPNFISGWNIEDSQLCDELVDFFETNQAMQIKGKTSSGIDPNSKRSTDIIIKPKMLLEPNSKYLNLIWQSFNFVTWIIRNSGRSLKRCQTLRLGSLTYKISYGRSFQLSPY